MTSRFVALGMDVAFRTNDPELLQELEKVLEPLAQPGDPAVVIDAMLSPAGRYAIHGPGSPALHVSRAKVLPFIANRLNRQVITETKDILLVHAAGAERDGVGLLLPGRQEAGKTTLVAALVLQGWRYLSDETVGIDPTTLELRPYHKPLSIDSGTWTVFEKLRPADPHGFHTHQWHVPVTEIGADPLSWGCQASLIVAPMYRPGAPTRLQAISRAEMLLLLGDAAFPPSVSKRQAIGVAGALVRRSRCFTLQISDLETATHLLNELGAGAHTSGEAERPDDS